MLAYGTHQQVKPCKPYYNFLKYTTLLKIVLRGRCHANIDTAEQGQMSVVFADGIIKSLTAMEGLPFSDYLACVKLIHFLFTNRATIHVTNHLSTQLYLESLPSINHSSATCHSMPAITIKLFLIDK